VLERGVLSVTGVKKRCFERLQVLERGVLSVYRC
jgi:hypothetical protein